MLLYLPLHQETLFYIHTYLSPQIFTHTRKHLHTLANIRKHSLYILIHHQIVPSIYPGESTELSRQPRHDIDGIPPADFDHHNYTMMESFLRGVRDLYPEITKLSSVGKSVEGRELYVLEITKDPGVHIPGKSNGNSPSNCHYVIRLSSQIS